MLPFDIKEALIWKLSGAAQYKSKKEMWFWDLYKHDITVEFDEEDFKKYIVRYYNDKKTNLVSKVNYYNGVIHGRYITYSRGGRKVSESELNMGIRHGKSIRYQKGKPYLEENWENGVFKSKTFYGK